MVMKCEFISCSIQFYEQANFSMVRSASGRSYWIPVIMSQGSQTNAQGHNELMATSLAHQYKAHHLSYWMALMTFKDSLLLALLQFGSLFFPGYTWEFFGPQYCLITQ